MTTQRICKINGNEFGVGLFIQKQPTLAYFDHSIYIKILWFKLGVNILWK
jgi:hypothetical protein